MWRNVEKKGGSISSTLLSIFSVILVKNPRNTISSPLKLQPDIDFSLFIYFVSELFSYLISLQWLYIIVHRFVCKLYYNSRKEPSVAEKATICICWNIFLHRQNMTAFFTFLKGCMLRKVKICSQSCPIASHTTMISRFWLNVRKTVRWAWHCN